MFSVCLNYTQITQNKGKERELLPIIEEISGGKAHINTRKLNQNILTVIHSLLIEKDVCDRQNISIKFLCAFALEISSMFGKSFPFPFPYFVLNYNK